MDSLVINSPISRHKLDRIEKSLPPLGLGYICTEIKKLGKTVEFIDAYSLNLSCKELTRKILAKRPKYLIINIFSINSEVVFEILISLPSEIIVICGGGVRGTELYNKIHTENLTTRSEPKINIGITGDSKFRRQFNITNGNYSLCSEAEINNAINIILALNYV